MNLKNFINLEERTKQLIAEYRQTIIDFIDSQGGHYTYILPQSDNTKLDAETRFPVCIRVYVRQTDLIIGLTDVYLKKESGGVNLYMGGKDINNNVSEWDITISSRHYEDVIMFLMHKSEKSFSRYIHLLAVKDLVEKYNKLPKTFVMSDRSIDNRFSDEYVVAVTQHRQNIERILSNTQAAKSDEQRDQIRSEIMELADDITTIELIQSQNILEDEMMFLINGTNYYKEEFQDAYHDIYDKLETELSEFFGFKMC